MLPSRTYGHAALSVSALGLGAIQLGEPGVDETQVAALLDAALDAGITLIDTAPGYGQSEARLGAWLARHPDPGLVLSTKLGYGVAGIEDWTGACIAAGVEQALRRLHVERIAIAHLHSCPLDILRREEVIAALEAAKQAGKVGAIAYSGEGEALAYAVETGRFDGYMASLNFLDQRVIEQVLPRLGDRGFIAKRPLANSPWRFAEHPHGDYSEVYWLRWRKMALPDFGMPWGELAIRFAVWHEGVSSAVAGTAHAQHLREIVAWAERGPLPQALVETLRDAFRRHDQDWTGQV